MILMHMVLDLLLMLFFCPMFYLFNIKHEYWVHNVHHQQKKKYAKRTYMKSKQS